MLTLLICKLALKPCKSSSEACLKINGKAVDYKVQKLTILKKNTVFVKQVPKIVNFTNFPNFKIFVSSLTKTLTFIQNFLQIPLYEDLLQILCNSRNP